MKLLYCMCKLFIYLLLYLKYFVLYSDKEPNLHEITFTIYDSKLSVKLGISQLRVKIGTFTAPLSSELASSSSSSSVAKSASNNTISSVSSSSSSHAHMTTVIDTWFKVDREKNSKDKEKPHPPEVHLHIEVIPGPMRSSSDRTINESPHTYDSCIPFSFINLLYNI